MFTLQSMIGVIQQYLAFEVITSTDVSYISTLSFPAITVCNQNRSIFYFNFLVQCLHGWVKNLVSYIRVKRGERVGGVKILKKKKFLRLVKTELVKQKISKMVLLFGIHFLKWKSEN